MPTPTATPNKAMVHEALSETALMRRDLVVTAPQPLRNAGVPLAPDWFDTIDVNLSAAERRAASLTTRRTVKKQWQAAWLVRAIECIDLTTLSGDDTEGRVDRLCAKARHPLRDDLKAALGLEAYDLTTGAVCVYPAMVPEAVKALRGSKVPVASVATGFPSGLTPLKQRLDEIRMAVDAGADEIDIVINRRFALTGNWAALYDETRLMREASGGARMKAILGTGDLKTMTVVYRAAMVAMMAGADFVKTSTGMEASNATLPVGLVMVRAIRDYKLKSGFDVAFKPAGGIRAAKDALAWLTLMKEEMGAVYLTPHFFRMGASGLLGDIERQIEHYVTGRYSASERHGLS
jgi:deoxyribose-phosphate aldolase